jgi:alkylated DNA repair dioxygenase AlkB
MSGISSPVRTRIFACPVKISDKILPRLPKGTTVAWVKQWFRNRSRKGWTKPVAIKAMERGPGGRYVKAKAVEAPVVQTLGLSASECASLTSHFAKVLRARPVQNNVSDSASKATCRCQEVLCPPLVTTGEKVVASDELHKLLIGTGVYRRVNEAVRAIVKERRSAEDLKAFDERYGGPDKEWLPNRSFANLFEQGRKGAGMGWHHDNVFFYTAIVSLTGDADAASSLQVRNSDGSERAYPLAAGDLLVFPQLLHLVPQTARSRDRITINLFF